MLTSYSRVTVVSGTRRVDLALPSSLPMADVVPQVLRYCAPEESPDNPTEFTLAKLGGPSLALSQSLGEAGVHDGDVIELRAFGVQTRPAFVEDVRDAIEDAVDSTGGAWTTRSTVTFAVTATSGVLLLVLLTPLLEAFVAVFAGDPLARWEAQRCTSAVAAAAVLLAITWVATRWAATWVSYASSAVSALWALAAGAEIVARSNGSVEASLTVGLAAAVALGAAARLMTPRAMPLLAAATVLLVACALVLVATSIGAEDGTVVRIVALLAVLSVGVMPRLSIAVSGLSSADYRVRNAGRISDQALSARLQESSGLLLGTIYGVSVLVSTIGCWLALRPDAWGSDLWDGLLSVSLAAALLLRSRVFSRTLFMLPLRVAAVVVVLGSVGQLADDYPTLDTWLAAAIAAVGAVTVGLSILQLSDITRARIKRTLNAIEFIVVIDLVVVTMGAVTLYSWLGGR